MKTCFECKKCISGILSIDPFSSVCDSTMICKMTGNIIIDEFGEEINTVACKHFSSSAEYIQHELPIEELPF